MPLRAKRIYDPPSPDDGVRVLVDRLWPRGLSKQRAAVDLWLKDIAPSHELRGWFHAGGGSFDEFAARYRAQIGPRPETAEPIIELARAGQTVTLLYASRQAEQNHAALLAGWLAGWSDGPPAPR